MGYQRDIQRSIDLISYAYSNATLVDEDWNVVPEAQMCIAYLKVYCQTPHEKLGQTKPPEPSRFAPVTIMSPFEYDDFVEDPMMRDQEDALERLYVYDPEYPGCELGEYLEHFYNEWYPEGWAIGYSPFGLFQAFSKGQDFARCTLLDLETKPEMWSSMADEMKARNKVDPRCPIKTSGMVATSSDHGMHFYSHLYLPDTPAGKVRLASQIGSALLLNKEGQPKNLDERGAGHQLRSLVEEWHPNIQDSEVSCVRATRSLLKPDQPEFVSLVY